MAQFFGCKLKWIALTIHLLMCFHEIVRSIDQPQPSKVVAVFTFGDSIMDTGNNNDMLTLIRCNFPPYGKDFVDQQATGRFSNGRIAIDFLAEYLGVKKIVPAFKDPKLKDDDLLTGVSFASSGSGYDPLTSQIFLVKSLEEQLNWFKEYIGRLLDVVGLDGVNNILGNSISFVVTGHDDLANTYFSTPFRVTFDADAYTDLLLENALPFFKKLEKYGLRKIGVSNVAPLGCLPIQRTLHGGISRKCGELQNKITQLFNNKLKHGLLNLDDAGISHSKFIYIDLYSIVMDLILNHTHYGFEVADKGCCGSGLIEGAELCNSHSLVCDADKYLFWDSYHPSQKAYAIIIRHVVDKYLHSFL